MAIDQAMLNSVQQSIWEGHIPLQITLAPSESRTYDQTDPYLISYPRISYLPSLLPRLKAFFSSSLIDPTASHPHDGWFSFEGVPLKWHYPVGLLYDLYAGADPATKSSDVNDDSSESGPGPLPWRLVLHFSDWPDEELVRLDANGMVMNDAFINSVKEADFVRNGTAKGIMSLSKDDSSGLWRAVQDVDLPSFQRIMNILLPPPSIGHQLRNLPIRLFLPLPPKPDSDSDSPFLKVVQSPIPPTIQTSQTQAMSQSVLISASRVSVSSPAPGTSAGQVQTQTIGTALNSLLPHLFPSRRAPVLAKPVLHGAAVPMSAPVEEVVRAAAYGDGWVYIVVRMMG
ncbi:autophagy protein 5 [Aspergillus undulatus]|uniref:autophagy protein 5 n=1 Tax=Aspergillus undulatus TaxID=1810928 RepID=UPI003CCE2B8F